MIRLIQRRLIIPRGDTGSFSIPIIGTSDNNSVAVFTIFDTLTKTKMFQKIISGGNDGELTIVFTHNDTVNLTPGKYVWDIKFYVNPQFVDEELVNGDEIDSYYAGYSLPECEIRETADNYLTSSEGPNNTLTSESLDIISGAINATEENVKHYPMIQNDVWYIWDATSGEYVSTESSARGNGISATRLNNDYTLTLTYDNGDEYTTPSIRGPQGEPYTLTAEDKAEIVEAVLRELAALNYIPVEGDSND